MTSIDSNQAIELARAVLSKEAQAVLDLSSRINDAFISACRTLLNPKGRIVVLGVGKSGHIGRKIAATLASTGSPAFFISAAEASHGDLGMIDSTDVAIMLSYSGTSDELLTLLPPIKRLGIPIISITGNPDSSLAQNANINLDVSVEEEACPLGLAPTTSTIAMLAMGDALAIALLDARGFSEEDFARSHPGGALGKKLLVKVSDIMRTGDNIPRTHETMNLKQGLLEMTSKGLGMTSIVDNQNKLLGIFTDGDLRRVLDKNMNISETLIKDVMTANCHAATGDQLAAEILATMQHLKINSLPVINDDNEVIGALNMHTLLNAGVV